MNVPWGIFDSSKNMATVTKNRTQGLDSSYSHISAKPLGLAEF